MKEIGESFAGLGVLVTGATGFMGKVLVEKLLRECPKMGQLYILARGRKGKTVDERLNVIFSTPLFEFLRKEQPKFREKITVLEGDISQPSLGLSPQDVHIMSNEVNVVIHAAATVRFDEPLRQAYVINVSATKELILMAKEFKNLKAFLHLSTAYSQCTLTEIDEKFYDAPIHYTKMDKIINVLDDDYLCTITPKLLGDIPNTYCFTKAIAEEVVRELGRNLPVAVLRPGIVVSTASEPEPGWVDNLNGPYALFMGFYTGVIHTLLSNQDDDLNFVPVDMCDNAVLAATAKLIQEGRNPEEDIKVYNYVTSSENAMTLRRSRKYLEKHGYAHPPMNNLWVYFLFITSNRYLFAIYSFLFHHIPATIFDAITNIAGYKKMDTSLFNIYKKFEKYMQAVNYFQINSWKWSETNTKRLWKEIHQSDREKFKFDMSSLDWDDYFKKLILGVRLHLLKEDPSTVDKALKRYARLTIAHNVLMTVTSLLAVATLYTVIPALVNLLFSSLRYLVC